jgi:hypothetical protein
MFKTLGYILVVIHVFLGGWAIGGIIELIAGKVPWKPFSNPEFPRWVLTIHWASILFAAGIFMFGYFTRWKLTPHFMVAAYGTMAVVCIIETFGFMTSKYKFLAMGLEYAAYILIVILLYHSRFASLHFKDW